MCDIPQEIYTVTKRVQMPCVTCLLDASIMYFLSMKQMTDTPRHPSRTSHIIVHCYVIILEMCGGIVIIWRRASPKQLRYVAKIDHRLTILQITKHERQEFMLLMFAVCKPIE